MSMQDPFADREASQYSRPVASRELILQILEQHPQPLSRPELIEILAIPAEDSESLEGIRRRLRAMERDGQIFYNHQGRYCLVSRTDLVSGRVQGHKDGYGFVLAEDGSEDLLLNNREMSRVFHGERVLVRVSGYDRRRERREASLVQALGDEPVRIVGRYQVDAGVAMVTPEDPRQLHDILIPESGALSAVTGQIVVVEITRRPGYHQPALGQIVEVLGQPKDPGMEIEIALRSHGIPHRFPAAVLAEAESFGGQVAEASYAGRLDLRHLPLFTIDGEDARDFDDAVYAEARKGGGWKLWVAIADVSHYVRVGSALDNEAVLRSTSVYFPEFVVPMLPEALSNGLCSLNPKVDRLALVAEMSISQQGRLSGYKFHEAVFQSAARLTYNRAAAILDGDTALAAEFASVVPALTELHRLYQALSLARKQRGAMEFESEEVRFLFGRERKIERLVPLVRNDAHKLIEECMICANVAAARFIRSQSVSSLLRIHAGPKPGKLQELRAILGRLGLELGGQGLPKPADYAKVAALSAERPDAAVIQTLLLRSMQQAVYSPKAQGHFGLALNEYAHFTSPIRRYPDLLIHRAIKASLAKARQANADSQIWLSTEGEQAAKVYSDEQLSNLGKSCSANERRADEATRDVASWLKCEFMSHRLGEVYDGVIASVTGFGLFVKIPQLYIEGLVHISALNNDYYRFEPSRQALVGERSGGIYRLGDPLRIQVSRVDLEERRIDFVEAQGAASSPSGQSRSRRSLASGSDKASETAAEPRRSRRSSAVSGSDQAFDASAEPRRSRHSTAVSGSDQAFDASPAPTRSRARRTASPASDEGLASRPVRRMARTPVADVELTPPKPIDTPRPQLDRLLEQAWQQAEPLPAPKTEAKAKKSGKKKSQDPAETKAKKADKARKRQKTDDKRKAVEARRKEKKALKKLVKGQD